jgi:hypothetical protein
VRAASREARILGRSRGEIPGSRSVRG